MKVCLKKEKLWTKKVFLTLLLCVLIFLRWIILSKNVFYFFIHRFDFPKTSQPPLDCPLDIFDGDLDCDHNIEGFHFHNFYERMNFYRIFRNRLFRMFGLI